jgi:hypothetical protein
MDKNIEDAVYRMILAKGNLDALPLDIVDAEYIAIQTAISKYIKKHCKHSIVSDHIDLSPETSATIFYCEHCYQVYPNDEGAPV